MLILNHLCELVYQFESSIVGFERLPPNKLLKEFKWVPNCSSTYCIRCGATRRPLETTCSGCCDKRLPYRRVIRLDHYAPPISHWICEVKFARWEAMGRSLGRMLGQQLLMTVTCREHRPNLVVPVPMPFVRRVSRGIDHARIVARGVADELGVPMRRPLYQRGGSTQVSRSMSERERQPSPFRIRRGAKSVAQARVLLVDDVLTTGKTARSATRVLQRLGASEVLLGVLAVTDSTPSCS